MLRTLGLVRERVGRGEQQRVEADRRSEVREVAAHQRIMPLARAAEAGEDLAADGEVPVAERGAHGRGVRRPGAAAQDLVVGTEEHLGVLAVREGTEPGVGEEVGRGPLPHSAQHPVHPVRAHDVVGSRRPVRVRTGAAPRARGRHRAGACPGRPLPTPPRWGGAPRTSAAYASASYQHTCCTGSVGGTGSVRPKRRRTQTPSSARAQCCGATNPASVRHAQPASVQCSGSSYPPDSTNCWYAALVTGGGVDPVRGELDDVRGAFVVVRPRVGVGAERVVTARDQHVRRECRPVGSGTRACRRRRPPDARSRP